MYLATEDGSVDEVIGEVTKQKNLLTQFWESIEWQTILISAIISVLQILLSFIIFFILKKVGRYVIETIFRKYIKEKHTVPNRYNTLYKLSQNIYNSVLYFFLVYTILGIMGIPVGTLIAGAGVIGLTLSLGAQGFVSDIVNGFMILLEKQLDVGDVVEINSILGVVEDVNLKTTKLKDFDGTIHFIPNRAISVISNRSRADMRVMIQIRLFPNTDLDKVRRVLDRVNQNLIPQYDEITIEPSEIAFVPIGAGQTAAQIIMYTKAGKEFGVRNAFYEHYVEALAKEGIELPTINFDASV
ncbi:mechanosensitive ion channel family protein [Marinilactibacillus psychrotolerans]|uniref:Small-conductance mechanosensitive channel n=1 Tax=Marinilactibacillus psychrotolerans TaxID=191770 RepID=A0AAV3WV51_9LACT|nr:mechanosensitive ion channel family protein [Marinilactibacillus psychrotolerans]GEL67807.1 mechanosensitive ion channel protein MscS [Marinilactibacillus psychrotolerans]GEQ36765.1 small-conductance mechanosensitive channel [Marinilactibacillus psychrotolerans]SDD19496.1 small conductance mechanosensitive channel [Marinilactibacillus psychrotolerans]